MRCCFPTISCLKLDHWVWVCLLPGSGSGRLCSAPPSHRASALTLSLSLLWTPPLSCAEFFRQQRTAGPNPQYPATVLGWQRQDLKLAAVLLDEIGLEVVVKVRRRVGLELCRAGPSCHHLPTWMRPLCVPSCSRLLLLL